MDTYQMESLVPAVESLVKQKNDIKNQVMNPHLNWMQRADLYAQVRSINEQIAMLGQNE